MPRYRPAPPVSDVPANAAARDLVDGPAPHGRVRSGEGATHWAGLVQQRMASPDSCTPQSRILRLTASGSLPRWSGWFGFRSGSPSTVGARRIISSSDSLPASPGQQACATKANDVMRVA